MYFAVFCNGVHLDQSKSSRSNYYVSLWTWHSSYVRCIISWNVDLLYPLTSWFMFSIFHWRMYCIKEKREFLFSSYNVRYQLSRLRYEFMAQHLWVWQLVIQTMLCLEYHFCKWTIVWLDLMRNHHKQDEKHFRSGREWN